MRWPRLVAAFTLVAVALIAGGSALIGSAHAARSGPAPRAGTAPLARHAPAHLARHTPVQLAGALDALERQLQRYLSAPLRQRALRVVPRRLLAPYPTTCFVASGGCSETPCVEFAGQGGGAISAAPGAVVLRTAVPTPFRPGAPALPIRQTCQGHLGTPKVFRVSLR